MSFETIYRPGAENKNQFFPSVFGSYMLFGQPFHCYSIMLSMFLSWVQKCNIIPKCNTVANTCGWLDHNCNSLTPVCNTVTSACFSQFKYFSIPSKECYVPRLWMTVIRWDGQTRCNFHRTVQCYGQMLYIAVHSTVKFCTL